MRAYLITSVLAFVLLGGAVAHAEAEAEGLDKAKAAFKQGVEHFKAKEFTKAAASFRQAYRLKPNWKLQSPRNPNTTAAATRITTMTAVSCSHKIRQGLLRPRSINSLGPC